MDNEDIDKLKDIKNEIGIILDVIGDLNQGTFLYKMDNDIAFNSIISLKIMIVGEVVNHLSPELTKQLPQFNWDNFISMRNSLIHGYDLPEKNKAKIWNSFVNNDLENLYSFAEEVIKIYQSNNNFDSSKSEEKIEPKVEERHGPTFKM